MRAEAKKPTPQVLEPLAPASVAGPVEVAIDPKDRRGPFRPERLSTVRSRLNGTSLARLFRVIDWALIGLTTVIAAAGFGPEVGSLLIQPFGSMLPFLVEAGLVVLVLRLAGAYGLSPREQLPRHLGRVWTAVAVAGVAGWALALMTDPRVAPGAILWGLAVTVALSAVHIWAWAAVRGWRRSGRLTPNIVVVGATDNAARLIEAALENRDANVLAIFDDRAGRVPPMIHGVPVLGNTEALLNHMILPYVDRIVITVTASAQARVRALIERLRVLPNAVTLFVDIEGHDGRKAALTCIADTPLAQVSGAINDERRAAVKRMQDMVLASLGLLAAAPVMLAVAIAIKLEDGGPVFFRQRRHGFNNEAIVVWKFRSMKVERADATAAKQVTATDDRVTRVGRVIRKASLDELPQIFNVLTGEMSLVGPRPHAIGMKTAGEESARLVAEYAWRHRMKPGITGWAQVNGSVGPVDTPELVRRRVALDLDYIERQSFWFDLWIMLITVPRLLSQRHIVR